MDEIDYIHMEELETDCGDFMLYTHGHVDKELFLKNIHERYGDGDLKDVLYMWGKKTPCKYKDCFDSWTTFMWEKCRGSFPITVLDWR